jgi:hypothetical protein
MWANLSFAQRFALTLVIVLAILFALALFGYLTSGWDTDAEAQPLPSSKYNARLLELDHEAVEQAYKNQIMHLFETWMKDERGQPQRAVNGARQAQRAYVGAMIEIEKREAK